MRRKYENIFFETAMLAAAQKAFLSQCVWIPLAISLKGPFDESGVNKWENPLKK